MRSLTELIQKVADGDRAARDELFATAYSELRKLARSRLRNRPRQVARLDLSTSIDRAQLKLDHERGERDDGCAGRAERYRDLPASLEVYLGEHD